MLSFSSTNTLKSFSAGLLSIHSLSSLYLCLGLPQPMCRTFHLALFNFMLNFNSFRNHGNNLNSSIYWTLPHSFLRSLCLQPLGKEGCKSDLLNPPQ